MKISKAIKHLLPGIFLLGFNIGTGSVTAMAKAGANYGMSLLWALFISCLITFILIHLYGRFTIITGETALAAFRKHIHPAVGIFFIVALTANVSGSVMGVMGIIADICSEWTKTLIDGGIKPVYFAVFFISVVYAIFLNGRTEFFQKALTVIVAIMAACFIINFFMLAPPLIEIVKGMVPHIPESPGGDSKSSFLIIASMVGTTVFSGLFIIRTTLVKEAGWSSEDLDVQRRDAFFSGFMMFVISAIIMAAAAGTLYVEGKTLEKPAEMITLLEPLAGPFAVAIFTLGIVAAGVSSQFPNVLLLPWLLCDYTGSERDMKQAKYRVMVFFISLLGLVVPVFHARPVVVMIASQAFGALILPVTVCCIIYLGNSKSVVGDKTYTVFENIVLALILVFALYSCASGLIGLADTLGKYI
jgi:Mn2+/Fe2+ NRAMP family transporter